MTFETFLVERLILPWLDESGKVVDSNGLASA
jgi:hypothetical protein